MKLKGIGRYTKGIKNELDWTLLIILVSQSTPQITVITEYPTCMTGLKYPLTHGNTE